MILELRDEQWLLIASAKDDKPVSVRPFDAITFSLGDLWARGRAESGLHDRSPVRIPNQGTVGREPPSSSGEYRADRPDVRAGGHVRALFAIWLSRPTLQASD